MPAKVVIAVGCLKTQAATAAASGARWKIAVIWPRCGASAHACANPASRATHLEQRLREQRRACGGHNDRGGALLARENRVRINRDAAVPFPRRRRLRDG